MRRNRWVSFLMVGSLLNSRTSVFTAAVLVGCLAIVRWIELPGSMLSMGVPRVRSVLPKHLSMPIVRAIVKVAKSEELVGLASLLAPLHVTRRAEPILAARRFRRRGSGPRKDGLFR